jgi:4-hydroxy-3-methylbut-2-enyl diphosphate reductase
VKVSDPNRLFYLTQTTLSLDDASAIIEVLKRRFPKIQGPPAQDICYATENRQQAVKHIASQADLLLVVGSENSSNSRRLVEVGENAGLPGHLIDDEMQIQPAWLAGANTVAITAGASAPEVLVQRVVGRLGQLGFRNVQEVEVIEEDVRFALPPELAPSGARLTQIVNG